MIPYIVYRWFFTVMLAGFFVVSFMDVQSFVELARAFSYIPTFTGFMNLFIPVALRLNCSVLVAILEFGVVGAYFIGTSNSTYWYWKSNNNKAHAWVIPAKCRLILVFQCDS